MATLTDNNPGLLTTETQFVRLGDIVSDPIYQRGLPRPAAIRALAAAWDDNKAGAVCLSYRNGRYYAMDGQTRVAAARLVKGASGMITAIVYRGLTIEQEAELFDAFNRQRRSPTTWDTFRARLAYHEPVATAIQQIVLGAGLTIGGHTGGSAPTLVSAFAALDNIYRSHGPDMLRRVLAFLRDGFGSQRRAYSTMPLLGMAALLARHPDLNETRLVNVLSRLGPARVEQIVGGLGALGSNASSVGNLWGQAVRMEYNKGLRSGSQLGTWPEKITGTLAQERGNKNRRRPERPE